MLPNSRRVRWLSASISRWYRACLIRRPPVLTKRYRKLVSDQFSIFFGSIPILRLPAALQPPLTGSLTYCYVPDKTVVRCRLRING